MLPVLYKLIKKSIKIFGNIDILVNNMYDFDNNELNNINDKLVNKSIKTNWINVIIFTNNILKLMIKNNNGQIIYISSGSSQFDGNTNNNIFPELYILIKNSIEKLTKLQANKY